MMLQHILPPVCYGLLFVAAIYKWRFFRLPGLSQTWVIVAYLLKVAGGLAFWSVYTYYYTDPSESDAFRYFKDALTIRDQWFSNRDVFWSFMLGRHMDDPEFVRIYDQLIAWSSAYRYGLSNDCSTIIRINVVVSFISFGSFHVHALFMSFMSFIGLAALYRAFASMFSGRAYWLFIACFALPSVVFWTSSILKESPLVMCLGLAVHAIIRIVRTESSPWDYVMFALCCVFMVYIKGYVIIALAPALLFLLLVKIAGQKMLWLKFILLHVIGFIVAQHAHYFFRGGDFLYVLHKRQIDFYNVAYLREAGSVVDIPQVTGVGAFFLNYPQAFVLTYFRPFLLEANGVASFVFSIENALYALLVVITLLFHRKMRKADRPIILAIISFLLVFAAIIGNCVPILGAIVRYKVPALLFLVILCFYFIDVQKISSVFQRRLGSSKVT